MHALVRTARSFRKRRRDIAAGTHGSSGQTGCAFAHQGRGYQPEMKRVGLVADPAKPTVIARGMGDIDQEVSENGQAWDVEIVSEPFTAACEDVDTALSRLTDRAREHQWDVVVGLTELPLHDEDGRYLLVETDPQQRTAVLSLPALGGLRMHSRSRNAVRELVRGLGVLPTHVGDGLIGLDTDEDLRVRCEATTQTPLTYRRSSCPTLTPA